MASPAAPPLWPVSIKGVVLVGGRLVLLRNERAEWELPGGRLERGEEPEACLAREIAEELSLQVAVGPLLDCWRYPVLPGKEVLVVTYGCAPLADGAPRLSHEHNAVGLFEPKEIASLPMPEAYKRAIALWLAAIAAGLEPAAAGV
jgi:8-oxo-dGTP pyrophosphatase MutT (NUDIX family)